MPAAGPYRHEEAIAMATPSALMMVVAIDADVLPGEEARKYACSTNTSGAALAMPIPIHIIGIRTSPES